MTVLKTVRAEAAHAKEDVIREAIPNNSTMWTGRCVSLLHLGSRVLKFIKEEQ